MRPKLRRREGAMLQIWMLGPAAQAAVSLSLIGERDCTTGLPLPCEGEGGGEGAARECARQKACGQAAICMRFAAAVTARSEACTMFLWTPTPKTVRPAALRAST